MSEYLHLDVRKSRKLHKNLRFNCVDVAQQTNNKKYIFTCHVSRTESAWILSGMTPVVAELDPTPDVSSRYQIHDWR